MNAIEFFKANAGFSYNPKTETKAQGRERCAIALANAEAIAKANDWQFCWNSDEDADLSWMSDEEREQPHEVLTCRVAIDDGTDYGVTLASLSGITDPSMDYCRVVQAELAQEAITELESNFVC